MQNTGSNIENLIETIVSTVNNDVIVNERVSERLNDIFKTSLQYLDSPRDRQVVKGLLAEITSVRFTTALQGIKSREGTTHAKNTLRPKLLQYQEICRTSQTVRSDLTVVQQHKLTMRIITARGNKNSCRRSRSKT